MQGIIVGIDGRAMSPTHTPRRGRSYRDYASQSVLKCVDGNDTVLVWRVPAAEIEAQVVEQVRTLIRQPEIVVGTWRATCADRSDIAEGETVAALQEFEPLCGQLFPEEQARIVTLLVEHVEVGTNGADIRWRVEGLASLARILSLKAAAA